MKPTMLKKTGMLARFAGGCVAALVMFGLGFLLPCLWVLVPFMPFALLWTYSARGNCPWCDAPIEVKAKSGGAVCKACKKSSIIKDFYLKPII